jgi:tetratricopeptide (TPR) repeat protein
MLGYPGHDTDSWPKLGERAQATLREGVICRLTDFLGGVSGTSAEMQKLQHSLVSWHGFSGSPLWRNRAAFSQTGSEQATSDLRRAQELNTADQDAGAAMYLAGAADPKERDGRKAWDLAIKANTVTDYKNSGHLSALAAAYAESGDFDHAVEFGKKAVQLAEGDQKDQITGQLKLYENKQPFRVSND